VFTLNTLPDCSEPFVDPAGKVAGFSLHAVVAARAQVTPAKCGKPKFDSWGRNFLICMGRIL